jgi:hypothetical protein
LRNVLEGLKFTRQIIDGGAHNHGVINVSINLMNTILKVCIHDFPLMIICRIGTQYHKLPEEGGAISRVTRVSASQQQSEKEWNERHQDILK